MKLAFKASHEYTGLNKLIHTIWSMNQKIQETVLSISTISHISFVLRKFIPRPKLHFHH